MKKTIETVYEPCDLKKGKCKSCKEWSKEIVIGDGRCIDCIETEKFINETISGIGTQRSPFDIGS
jgi:hypothetical protein